MICIDSRSLVLLACTSPSHTQAHLTHAHAHHLESTINQLLTAEYQSTYLRYVCVIQVCGVFFYFLHDP
jgi:hypothetical protein